MYRNDDEEEEEVGGFEQSPAAETAGRRDQRGLGTARRAIRSRNRTMETIDFGCQVRCLNRQRLIPGSTHPQLNQCASQFLAKVRKEVMTSDSPASTSKLPEVGWMKLKLSERGLRILPPPTSSMSSSSSSCASSTTSSTTSGMRNLSLQQKSRKSDEGFESDSDTSIQPHNNSGGSSSGVNSSSSDIDEADEKVIRNKKITVNTSSPSSTSNSSNQDLLSAAARSFRRSKSTHTRMSSRSHLAPSKSSSQNNSNNNKAVTFHAFATVQLTSVQCTARQLNSPSSSSSSSYIHVVVAWRGNHRVSERPRPPPPRCVLGNPQLSIACLDREREKGAFDCPDNVICTYVYEGRTKGAAMSTQSYQMLRGLKEEEEEEVPREKEEEAHARPSVLLDVLWLKLPQNEYTGAGDFNKWAGP
ncbi:LOW QUALITY PROTEIN: hypothetical protein DAPPUDRAFT_243520 [Daphnia pulex]|uniref:Uncharacterized protein n=1 Tax=Daphnia pulex TaxID=6669 RepID=E9GJ08_DAPPU|nr:LOW QUALITY PROTEIN: hypothetical protein DAPPUDRAFT_243520 [Daphnia pulex]|eukprot:EFX80564.1 LOW QUALITY PROTEIN: hypothetical protein DAPPUDRAFT_243520 [Daphnia pulex]